MMKTTFDKVELKNLPQKSQSFTEVFLLLHTRTPSNPSFLGNVMSYTKIYTHTHIPKVSAIYTDAENKHYKTHTHS